MIKVVHVTCECYRGNLLSQPFQVRRESWATPIILKRILADTNTRTNPVLAPENRDPAISSSAQPISNPFYARMQHEIHRVKRVRLGVIHNQPHGIGFVERKLSLTRRVQSGFQG